MSDKPNCRPRLAWHIHPYKAAQARLERAGLWAAISEPLRRFLQPRVGIPYAYDTGPWAEIVAWAQPVDKQGLRHLRQEADKENSFDRWVAHAWPLDIWHLAAAWSFYEMWVTFCDHPNWRIRMQKPFSTKPLLDQLLAQSFGRVMWRFQLEALIFAATNDIERARHLAKEWVLQAPECRDKLAGLVLPSGLHLVAALDERACRTADKAIYVRGSPDMAVAARIHAIYSHASSSP